MALPSGSTTVANNLKADGSGRLLLSDGTGAKPAGSVGIPGELYADADGRLLVNSGAVAGTSVQDFGAVGDGVTDDLAAINAAIAALPASGGLLYFPVGNYLVSGAINIESSNVTVQGVGSSSKITLKAGAASTRNVLRFNSSQLTTPPTLTNCGVRYLKIDGQGGDNTWTGGGISGTLVALAVDGIDIDHVTVVNGRDTAIQTYGCTKVSVTNNRVDTVYWQTAANAINVRGGTGSARQESDDAVISGNFAASTTSVAISTATAAANVATYTTSAAHKFSTGQQIKVTGASVNAYNGYWTVASTPTNVTFTVSLGSTPANASGGAVVPMIDRGIYVGSIAAYRTQATNNNVQQAVVPIAAEVGAGGAFDISISDNIVSDFKDVGLGIDDSSGTANVYGHRAVLANNVIRGIDGTTAFGVASTGSTTGIQLNGEIHRCMGNQITNVRQGILAGLNQDVEETDYAINGNTVVLAADANGSGIYVQKNVSGGAQFLRRVQIQNNLIDGLVGTTSAHGIRLTSRVVDFDVADNTVRGMGRHGIYLETANGAGASTGRVRNNTLIDNSTTSSGTYNGIQVDASSDSVIIGRNRAYDTRTPKLQGYGLRIESAATNIRSKDDDFTGNLTGEFSDATTAKIPIQDYRDPLGLAVAWGADPRNSAAPSAGTTNRTYWMRVTGGGGAISKVGVYIGTIDSSTPGTTDQIAVALYGNTGSGRSALPGTRKAVSASTLAVASTFNQVSLGATVQANVGDWLAFSQASGTTQAAGITVANGSLSQGFNAAQDVGSLLPPSTPAATSGTSARVPVLIGIP